MTTVLRYRWKDTGSYFTAQVFGDRYVVYELGYPAQTYPEEIIFDYALPMFEDHVAEYQGEKYHAAMITALDQYVWLDSGHRLPRQGHETIGSYVLGMKVC